MAPTNSSRSGRGVEFGLIFFSSSEAPSNGDRYRLVIESAKFADQHGFSSIWIPERHFTKDGWLYPNPAVLQAALARETTQIGLRAGSVVMPLHNPLRVAEEWAMVDNLSGGRVGVSFASGWHPNDFALFPENYATRNDVMYSGIEMVRKLWRGEAVEVPGGDGKLVELRTYPPPIQPELPIWITAAGNPKTFAGAGKIGAHLLTHMYNQSIDELAEKIRVYRESLAEHGYDPAQGKVSVMLHTFVGPDEETVRQQVQGPFCEYLKGAAYLLNAIAYSRGQKVDLNSLSEQDLQDYLLFVFERLISNQRVLFGTPESCRKTVALLQQAGVDEIACQMDFGITIDQALGSLPSLNGLKDLCSAPEPEPVATYKIASSNGAHPPVTLPVQKKSLSETPAHVSAALPDVRRRCTEEVALNEFYQHLGQRGIQLGASFQGIERLWRRDGESLGQIRLPASVEQEADLYHMHPTLLDACFQVVIAAVPQSIQGQPQAESALYLPVGIRNFEMYQQPGRSLWSHASILPVMDAQSDQLEGNVRILDERGQLVAEAQGLRLQRSEPVAPVAAAPTTGGLDEWLYELQWEATTLPTPAATIAGHWLIFADRQGNGDLLRESLLARGASVTTVVPGRDYQVISDRTYQLNPVDAEQVQRLLRDIRAQQKNGVRGVIHLWSLDATPAVATSAAMLEADQMKSVGSALHLVQALASLTNNAGETLPRLWLVTRGAQPVQSAEVPEITQAPLWGIGKTCAIEHPELWGGLIDIDPEGTRPEAAARLLQVIAGQHNEDQIAFRQGQSYVARMIRVPKMAARPLVVRHDGAYLITGGLWGLGLEVARWLAQKGAGHLILLGRTRLPDRSMWGTVEPGSRIAHQITGLRALEALGASVQYASVDVADETQLANFLHEYAQQSLPPIRGVMHAASVWQDAQGQSLVRPLINITLDDLRTVFRPKVLGSWSLQTIVGDKPLDFFVSFSSGASLFGSAAQGNYAAAGEFLDILAHYQRAQGVPGLSIDWGAVSETGFGATSEGVRVHEYWESHGIHRITPAQVLAALELLIPQDRARVGVLKLDWQALQQFFPQLTRLPLVTHLVAALQEHRPTPEIVSGEKNSILHTILAGTREERQEQLQVYLRDQVAGVLRVSPQRLDVTQPLTTLGLDSLMAIELKNRIELELAVRIPIVTFLQGPSIEQFSSQVFEQIKTASDEPQPEVAESPQGEKLVALSIDQQEAERLLGQLDQLSEQEIDTLLQQMLGEEQGQGNNGSNGGNGYQHVGEELLLASSQDAERLLAQLDQLSDDQVEALLSQIEQQEGDTK